MKKLKVYEYSGCSTCKKALKFLDSKKISYEKVDITKNPPTKKELEQMLHQVGGAIKKLFNTSGQQYRELNISEKLPKMTEKEVIEMLSTNGRLVKRPFLLAEKWGTVGFKEEEWKKNL